MSLIAAMRMFPDDEATEKWIAQCHWGDEPAYPKCGSLDVQVGTTHPNQPCRCRIQGCRRFFSVKTGIAMAQSSLGYQVWAMARYLMAIRIKGRSSLQLHRDLGASRKTAWFLARRIREAWERHQEKPVAGPVEVDETYIGGKERNRHFDKRASPGVDLKTAVVGAKDRATGQLTARVVERPDGATMSGGVTSTNWGCWTVPTAGRIRWPLRKSGIYRRTGRSRTTYCRT